MFFGKKPLSETLLNALIEKIADFYQLPANSVKNWLSQNKQQLDIQLPFAAKTDVEQLQTELQQILLEHDEHKVSLAFHADIKRLQTKRPAIKGTGNIIAVASGKGGVGKSATAVNLAFALMQQGANVGILDADIYGPSVPIMLGNKGASPASEDGKIMQPIEVHGVVANSIGYLVPEDDAAVWRGPMASKALQQLLNETQWPDLDYLILDMPPGTGDIQLTLAQNLPVAAAVVVTTPQDLALADATKGIAMFDKVDVPVLGIIENMSYYLCENCGHKAHIFASQGGEKLSQKHALPLLGQLPLDLHIRQHADEGKPLLITEPGSAISQQYREVAKSISKALYQEILHSGEAIDVLQVR